MARDIPLAVVDLLSGPLGLRSGRLDQALSGIALSGLRTHFVEVGDYAAIRRCGVAPRFSIDRLITIFVNLGQDVETSEQWAMVTQIGDHRDAWPFYGKSDWPGVNALAPWVTCRFAGQTASRQNRQPQQSVQLLTAPKLCGILTSRRLLRQRIE
jgi:hypothetical protein